MDEAKQDLTHGQRLVGAGFNPSNNPKVDRLKQLAAEQIDILDEIHAERGERPSYDANTIHGEAVRRVMDAQMWTVKDATWTN